MLGKVGMDLGVLFFVRRKRGEGDALKHLAKLDEDQFSGLVLQVRFSRQSDMYDARHDRLNDVYPVTNLRHAIAVNLDIAGHDSSSHVFLSLNRRQLILY